MPGIAGAFGQSSYAAAKMGLVGLARIIAWEGRQYGIRANLVAPGFLENRGSAGTLTPDKVTPMLVRLVHHDCPVTGQANATILELLWQGPGGRLVEQRLGQQVHRGIVTLL